MLWKGSHNSKRKFSILLDNFIRQGSGKQIGIILIVVILLFIGAVWVYDKKAERGESSKATIVTELVDKAYVANTTGNNEQPLSNNDSLTNTSGVQVINGTTAGDVTDDNEIDIWDKTYDVFVQSINPSPSEVVKSTSNKWVVFGLFLLISFGLSGLVFTILINMFDRRKEEWENGDIDYKIKKDFYLIIGGHKMVNQLCADLLPPYNTRIDDNTVIVIQTRRKAIMLRKEIEAKIGKELAKRIFIYNGERTSKENLETLNPQCAKEIFIIGEENFFDGTSHDAFSLQCLNLINEIMKESDVKPDVDAFNLSGKIPCHVMFEYQTSTKIFQYTDRDLNKHLDFIPFNYYEKWAAQVLVSRSCPTPIPYKDKKSKGSKGKKEVDVKEPITYPSILGKDPKIFINSNKRVHIIIYGMSKMGTMFGAMAAHLCHFPNFFENTEHPRTLITFIDPKAKIEMNYFKGRNPTLCELARWRYVDANAEQFMSSDQVPKEQSMYQKQFKGIDPMNQEGAKSAFSDCGIEPNLMDIDWEFIQGDIGTPSIQKYIQDAAEDEDSITTIAICNSVEYEAVSAAMFLPENVYITDNVTQILVFQQSSDAIVSAASQKIPTGFVHKFTNEFLQINPYQKLRPFGMFDQCSYLNRMDFLPMLVHMIYDEPLYKGDVLMSPEEMQEKFYKLGLDFCIDLNKTIEHNKPIGTIETAISKYAKLSTKGGKSVQALRASNIYNSYSVLYKAEVLGISASCSPLDRLKAEDIEKVDMLAQIEHNRWNTEQMFVGYRPVKQTDKPLYSANVVYKNNRTGTQENSQKNPASEQDSGSSSSSNQTAEVLWGTRADGKFKPINLDKDRKLRRIHPDIHSYYETEKDKGLSYYTRIYDINIGLMTPVLLKIYEMLKDPYNPTQLQIIKERKEPNIIKRKKASESK